MRGQAVYLSVEHVAVILDQLQETASYRGWELSAVAVMANHIHIVVGVPEDPEPETLLRDFKSYASRRLNQRFERPASGTWWTESGSRRKLPDELAVNQAVSYVERQQFPLLVWVNDCTMGTENQNQGADAPRSPGARS